jgi:hypothetical protein
MSTLYPLLRKEKNPLAFLIRHVYTYTACFLCISDLPDRNLAMSWETPTASPASLRPPYMHGVNTSHIAEYPSPSPTQHMYASLLFHAAI